MRMKRRKRCPQPTKEEVTLVLEMVPAMQEEMLVDAIVEHLKARRGPQALVEDLEIVSIFFVLFFYGLVWGGAF